MVSLAVARSHLNRYREGGGGLRRLMERVAEVLALISLKKFRHLRRSYHAHEGPR